ncbi:helix-turn-helix transcriptional regulator, partial [Streptomyces apricus]
AGLQAVAKAAGVGQGTLYRHSPDREALLLAVYEEEVAAATARDAPYVPCACAARRSNQSRSASSGPCPDSRCAASAASAATSSS